MEEADESQSDLLNEIKTFNKKTRPKVYWSRKMKEDVNNLYEAREMVLNGFKSKIFLQNLQEQVFLIPIILNLKY